MTLGFDFCEHVLDALLWAAISRCGFVFARGK
jgi:hypothetical protein